LFRRLIVMVIFIMALVGYYMVGTARADSISLTPSLRLGEQWDSNPLLTVDEREARQDFVTQLSPQIAVRSLTRGVRVSGLYRLDSNYYSRYRELNYVGQTAVIAVDSELSPRTSLSMGDTYSFTPYSREASEVGIQIQRTDIESNRAFATMRRMLGSASSVSLRLENLKRDYDDESLFDTRTDSASLSGDYGFSSNTSLTMSYTYTDYKYESAAGDSGTVTHSAQLGVSNQLSPGSSISVSGGVVYVVYDGDFDEAPTWTASANYAKAFQATLLNLDYSRSVTTATGLANEVNIRESVSMTLNHTFGRSFRANVGGSLLKNRSVPSGYVDTTSYAANAGLVWRALKWLSIDARYSRFQQWADDLLGVNITRDQVFIGLTATPNEWRF